MRRSPLRIPWRTYLVVLAVLVGLRAVLPFGLRRYVERVLDGSPAYEADLGDLDLNLWRGAYEVEGLTLYKASRGPDSDPFFECARLDLSIHWPELLRGLLATDVELHRPVLRFVEAEDEGESQTGEEVSWDTRLRRLTPFRIDRLAARDGELHFLRRIGEDSLDLYVTDVYLEALDLTNVADPAGDGVAELEVAGRPFETGQLEAVMTFDPLAERARFDLALQVVDVELPELNDYLQTYAGVDAEKGMLSVYNELVLDAGEVEGYVKVLIDDARVLNIDEADGLGDTLEVLWEGVVDLTAELLENQPTGRVAAKVPLEGSVGDVTSGVVPVIVSLLENAFVKALRPSLDRTVALAAKAPEGTP